MKARLFAFLFSILGFTLSLQAQVKDVKRHPIVFPAGVQPPKHTAAAGNPKNLPSSRKGDYLMKGGNIKLKPVTETQLLSQEERKKRLPSNSKPKTIIPALPAATGPQALSPEERKKRLPSNSKPNIVVPALPTTNSKP